MCPVSVTGPAATPTPYDDEGYRRDLSDDERAFQRLYGPWEAFDPEQARTLFEPLGVPWWVAGGWAIEAFTGIAREHEDIDVSMFRRDLGVLRSAVAGRFHVWAAGSGQLFPIVDTDAVMPRSADGVWLRAHALAPWRVDVVLNPDDDGRWVSRRDPTYVVDLDVVTWELDGMRYLRPEVVIAFKAKLMRPKDEADLAATLPLLDAGARAWLRTSCSGSTRVTRGWSGSEGAYAVKAMSDARARADRVIYLDHAATTPMYPEVVEAMTRMLTRVGNPSSLHGSGRAARRVVEESREMIAAAVNARPSEVVFTSGGTESDNLALKGAFWSARSADPARTGLVSSTIEHHAVLDSLGWLRSTGADVHLCPVDAAGRLAPDDLAAAVSNKTALVTVMWANNEVGTVQPIERVVAAAAAHEILVHSDAVQAVGHLPVDFGTSGLHLLSFAAHKLGGPYGVGALLARRDVPLTSLQHGGGQEREVRSGTLDVAAVAGFAAAVEVAVSGLTVESARVRALRDRLITSARIAVPDAVLNGSPAGSADGLPGVANLTFPGVEADAVLMLLDAAGIDCSTGSACSAGVSQPSHVLLAMGRSEASARASLRFSLGHTTTSADIDRLGAALPEAVRRARLAFA